MGRKPRPAITTRSDLLDAIRQMEKLVKQPLPANPYMRKSAEKYRKLMKTEIKQLTRAVRRLDESDRKRLLKRKKKS